MHCSVGVEYALHGLVRLVNPPVNQPVGIKGSRNQPNIKVYLNPIDPKSSRSWPKRRSSVPSREQKAVLSWQKCEIHLFLGCRCCNRRIKTHFPVQKYHQRVYFVSGKWDSFLLEFSPLPDQFGHVGSGDPERSKKKTMEWFKSASNMSFFSI
jgi:hypothetical protein